MVADMIDAGITVLIFIVFFILGIITSRLLK